LHGVAHRRPRGLVSENRLKQAAEKPFPQRC
jgi:hypothetical protein